eukprot:CAMPEP_0197518052 /NCGR_PEP_ID=MMETSP1318-20131121/3164_1 /TAXON_ID=552666 /ORGANISM="Partenskyella glossopodia, Strain RCC365" /LENGTH=303 /DNA_ID=CAMNT_0043068099 /DNA_START=356 /DNA_END=1267 /DNA_ORIENTATION=+
MLQQPHPKTPYPSSKIARTPIQVVAVLTVIGLLYYPNTRTTRAIRTLKATTTSTSPRPSLPTSGSLIRSSSPATSSIKRTNLLHKPGCALHCLRGGGSILSKPKRLNGTTNSTRKGGDSSEHLTPHVPVVKCRIGCTVRAFELRKRTFAFLQLAVARALGIQWKHHNSTKISPALHNDDEAPPFTMTFVDPDGDKLPLNSDSDLSLAVRLASSRSPPHPVRVIVTPIRGVDGFKDALEVHGTSLESQIVSRNSPQGIGRHATRSSAAERQVAATTMGFNHPQPSFSDFRSVTENDPEAMSLDE